MIRPRRFLAVFAVTSVVLTAVSVITAGDWRPATDRPALGPSAEAQLPTAGANPVTQRSVTVPAAEGGAAVAAWIVRPDGPTRRPGAVLVHGAGSGNRDDLLTEAHALAAAGVAVIVYDKRTRGYNGLRRDFAVLAEDALRAADVLRSAPGVDPDRVGLMGWSEGGWVVIEAARRAPQRTAFVGLVSAPVVSPAQQIAWAARRAVPDMPRWFEKSTATVLGAAAQVLSWTAHDSRPGLAALSVPVFGVWGADDATLPVNEAVGVISEEVHSPLSLHVVPGAGHQIPVDSRYLERVAEWLGDGGPDAASVRGVEPTTVLGAATLPRPPWFSNPLIQLALGVAVAAAVSIRWRPRRSDRRHPVPGGTP